MRYLLIFFLFTFSFISVNGQSKPAKPALSTPVVVVDIETDTIDMPKLMVWQEDIIRENKEGRVFSYSEIQDEDSIASFVYMNTLECYTYNKKLPDLVFFKQYSLLNYKIMKYGYYFDDHQDRMFLDSGTKIGNWKYYDYKGKLREETDYDALHTITWDKALKIAMAKLKCSQKKIKMQLLYRDGEDSFWEIRDKNNNRYMINAETGIFSKAPALDELRSSGSDLF